MTFLRFCREKWWEKKEETLHSWFPLQNQWTELAELTDVQFLIELMLVKKTPTLTDVNDIKMKETQTVSPGRSLSS